MKKCLTLPFLFIAFVAFAQPKIHSITNFIVGKENQKRVQLFDYQDNGLTVKQQSWEYKRVDSTPRLTGERTKKFRNINQLLSDESFYFYPEKVKNTDRTDYKYDVNGCLIERQRALFKDNSKENYIFQTQIKANANCLTSEETLNRGYSEKGPATVNQYATIKKYEYDSKGLLKAVRYALKDTATDFGFIEYTRRADGKIIEINERNPCDFCIDYDIPSRYLTDYNADGQIIMKKRINSYNNKLMDSTVYSYNSQAKISREVHFSFDSNGRFNAKEILDYEYDSYCDDLLKNKTTRLEYEDSFSYTFKGISKEIYTYTEGSTCDKKETIDFTIAPNPAFWQATIASESLATADNVLTIYNAIGAIMATYTIDFRTNTFDFPTLDLINGTYLIRLTNGKNSATKKLVVLH
jgi:hypothetical protein